MRKTNLLEVIAMLRLRVEDQNCKTSSLHICRSQSRVTRNKGWRVKKFSIAEIICTPQIVTIFPTKSFSVFGWQCLQVLEFVNYVEKKRCHYKTPKDIVCPSWEECTSDVARRVGDNYRHIWIDAITSQGTNVPSIVRYAVSYPLLSSFSFPLLLNFFLSFLHLSELFITTNSHSQGI